MFVRKRLALRRSCICEGLSGWHQSYRGRCRCSI